MSIEVTATKKRGKSDMLCIVTNDGENIWIRSYEGLRDKVLKKAADDGTTLSSVGRALLAAYVQGDIKIRVE